MVLMSFLRDQPFPTNSAATQSSNSRWLGRSPRTPKSFSVVTMPSPKRLAQISLATTRGVRGFPLLTSQRARSSRSPRSARCCTGGRVESVPAVTGSSGSLNSPRRITRVSRRSLARSPRTRTVISGLAGGLSKAVNSATTDHVFASSRSKWASRAAVSSAFR